MARYELDYEGTYGLGYGGYGERERYEPTPRAGRRYRGRPTRGAPIPPSRWRERGYGGEYMGRERPGYGREYMVRERQMRRGGGAYGREYMGYGLGYGTAYGGEYGGAGAGYGREYEKSRWETDYGDPFRDRERGTPIRMIRGEYGEYGEEFLGRERGMGYGVEYRPRPRRRYRY